jgi:hypothetical protein
MANYLDSLCWNCTKGADECCFMESLEPVEGWKAKKVPYEDDWTYQVISCPDFVLRQTKENEKTHKKQKSGVKIRCIETGKVYDSIKRCADDIHVSPSYISLCLVGCRKIRGFHLERLGR